MHTTNKRRRYLLALSLTTLLAAAAAPSSNLPTSLARRSQEPKPHAKLPVIITRVKKLEAVRATLTREGEPDAAVAIEIRNKSDLPIIAVAIEAGDEKDAAGVVVGGFKEGDEAPAVIIGPRGTKTVEIPLSYVQAGTPIKISGVMYADGTEDGDEASLKTIRGFKEHQKKEKP